MSMDRTLGDTLYILFTTRAFATGAPSTLGGVPVVSAYENSSITQITAGITLGVDHDGVTGLNLMTIVASGANGYSTAKDYNLVITTGTVDAVSVVGEVVGEFSLSLSAAAVDLANGTDGLGAIKTETALIFTDTNELQNNQGNWLTATETTVNAATANQIADHVIRRSWANVEASSDGDTIAFRSLLGAVAKLVNKVAISGTDLQIFRDDDTTVLGTQALSTDASAEPIVGIDTT